MIVPPRRMIVANSPPDRNDPTMTPSARLLLSFLALVALLVPLPAQNAVRHVEVLASPEFQGRQTATDGERRAAEYLAGELARIGAVPLPGADGFQHPFLRRDVVSDEGTRLRIFRGEPVGVPNSEWASGQSLHGLSFTASATAAGPVVFLESAEREDLSGAIVVVSDPRSESARAAGVTLEVSDTMLHNRARPLAEAGASGIVFIADGWAPDATQVWPEGQLGIPIVILSEKAGSELRFLGGTGLLQADLAVAIRQFEVSARNVIGLLPPSPSPGDRVSSTVLIMGAHFDHLGTGLPDKSLANPAPRRSLPHLGADDNASGCAAVLQAAELLATRPRRRAVVLAFWSGEEIGLLGSRQFMDDPPIPRADMMAYMNFDMVGRMSRDRLYLNVTQQQGVWRRFVQEANREVGLTISKWTGRGWRSDGDSFRDADIPVLDFFTGFHPQYHTPEDKVGLINAEGLDRVARLGARIAEQIVNYGGG